MIKFAVRILPIFLFIFINPPCSVAIENGLLLRKIIRQSYIRPLVTKPFEKTKRFLLGQALFFDPILSGNRDVSCATCHLLKLGTSDAVALAIGTQGMGLGVARKINSRDVVPRNSLDLWNRDNNSAKSLFWDGRVEVLDPKNKIFRSPLKEILPKGLENILAVQALFPLARDDEMLGLPGDNSPKYLPPKHANLPNEISEGAKNLMGPKKIMAVHSLLMERLLGLKRNKLKTWQIEYRKLFQEAYPDKSTSDFSIVELGNAIAHFEEIAFATRNTPWDEYLSGNNNIISKKAKKGAIIFFGKGKCAVCHSGPLFSDFEFYSLSVKQIGPGTNMSGDDKGRYNVTNKEKDKYKFRTPPLRNVTLTAPYFHDGVALTLQEAISHHLEPHFLADKYDETGTYELNIEQIQSLSFVLKNKIYLSEFEITALMEFLKTLEDNQVEMQEHIIPESVPSGLPISALRNESIQ
jgi:cytochrome c peroxidase